MIRIKEKDNSVTWDEMTDLLHICYAEHLNAGINFWASRQNSKQTQERAEPSDSENYQTYFAYNDNKLVGCISCAVYPGG